MTGLTRVTSTASSVSCAPSRADGRVQRVGRLRPVVDPPTFRERVTEREHAENFGVRDGDRDGYERPGPM